MLSVTSPTSQLILQPFRRFTYVTTHSPTVPLLHQRHSSFSNPSFASPTSHALHLRHVAGRPCYEYSCARTRKVITTLPIPAVAFKETTNSPSPPTPFKYFRGKILLTRQTDYSVWEKAEVRVTVSVTVSVTVCVVLLCCVE